MDIKKRPNYKIYLKVLRQMSPEKRLLKAFELSEFTGNFLFTGYTRGSRILMMKNLKKYFWSVWINVTTGITKKGYSST